MQNVLGKQRTGHARGYALGLYSVILQNKKRHYSATYQPIRTAGTIYRIKPARNGPLAEGHLNGPVTESTCGSTPLRDPGCSLGLYNDVQSESRIYLGQIWLLLLETEIVFKYGWKKWHGKKISEQKIN